MSGFFSRTAAFLSDSRLPIYYPFNRSRWDSLRSRIDDIALGDRPELDFLFTMDVEYDYGSREANLVVPFLNQAKGFFAEHGLRTTLFMQGDLIAKSGEAVRLLGNKHEIGLHGYSHELWGTSWFVKESPPSPAERKNLLDESLNAFTEAGFPRPQSFRAPRMVIDEASLGLLKDAGFSIDSSFPSYLGGLPILTQRQGLLEVPVSLDPKPVFDRFLRATYVVFNMHNIVTGELDIAEAAVRVAKAQVLNGQRPFIVFLSHSWEFFEPGKNVDKAQYGYSSPKNFDVLSAALSELESRFKVRYITMQELGRLRSSTQL